MCLSLSSVIYILTNPLGKQKVNKTPIYPQTPTARPRPSYPSQQTLFQPRPGPFNANPLPNIHYRPTPLPHRQRVRPLRNSSHQIDPQRACQPPPGRPPRAMPSPPLSPTPMRWRSSQSEAHPDFAALLSFDIPVAPTDSTTSPNPSPSNAQEDHAEPSGPTTDHSSSVAQKEAQSEFLTAPGSPVKSVPEIRTTSPSPARPIKSSSSDSSYRSLDSAMTPPARAQPPTASPVAPVGRSDNGRSLAGPREPTRRCSLPHESHDAYSQSLAVPPSRVICPLSLQVRPALHWMRRIKVYLANWTPSRVRLSPSTTPWTSRHPLPRRIRPRLCHFTLRFLDRSAQVLPTSCRWTPSPSGPNPFRMRLLVVALPMALFSPRRASRPSQSPDDCLSRLHLSKVLDLIHLTMV